MNNSFEDYIFSFKKPLGRGQLMILGILSLIVTLIGFSEKITGALGKIDPETLDYLIHINIGIHLFVLIVFLFFPTREYTTLTDDQNKRKKLISFLELKEPSELEKVYNSANIASSEFLISIKRILWAWLGLYVVLIIKIFLDEEVTTFTCFYVDGIQIFFNNLASIFLILAFVIVSVPAKNPYKTHIQNREKLFAALIVMTLAEFALRFIAQRNSWDANEMENLNLTFYMLSGCVGSIATAQLIGRLDSKLIGTKQWVLIAMYTYAAIQPFFPLFEKYKDILTPILYLALFLKIVLVLFVFWIISDNKLFYYLIRVSKIHQLISEEWNDIKHIIDDSKGQKNDL